MNFNITLSRERILLIGIGMIILYLLLNRFDFMLKSNTTRGKVVESYYWNSQRHYPGYFSAPVIQFNCNSGMVTFLGETNDDLAVGSWVRVIYQRADPEKARVYSFVGFWLLPMLYCLIPLMLLAAAVLSFLSDYDTVHVKLGTNMKLYRSKSKPADRDSRQDAHIPIEN